MFDVSFSELVLILIVGLLVFGPEKLPEVVRTTGLWLGKLRRSFNQIRTEIEREAGIEELKRDLHNQSIMESLKDVHNDLRKTQQEIAQIPYDVRDVIEHNAPLADQPKPVEISAQTETAPSMHTPTIAADNEKSSHHHD